MSLRIRAPVELENLLPYDIKYRVYDKNASLNWTSSVALYTQFMNANGLAQRYLRRGGVMPVHSVELTHLLLLNIEAQDSGQIMKLCHSHQLTCYFIRLCCKLFRDYQC
jgi:vacuolar protein sorting-associated protein 13A/C